MADDLWKKYLRAKKKAKVYGKKLQKGRKQAIRIGRDVGKELRKAEKKIDRIYY